jgi:hypothetical protein
MPTLLEKEYIERYIHSDINSIILNKNKFESELDIELVINQVFARQKFHSKFPNLCANLDFLFPEHLALEQASSEACSKFKASLFDYSISADLNGGMGIDSFEFAKHSKQHFYNEINIDLVELFERNSIELNLKNIETHCGDALDLIDKLPSNTDFIYFDPSRRSDSGAKTYFIQDTKPNPIEVINKILNKFRNNIYPKVLIKASPLLDVSKAVKELKYVSKVWIISVDNEVKETLFLLDLNTSINISYTCVNLKTDNIISTEFNGENSIMELISRPLKYLYEPNRSLLKLGFWGEICEKFNMYQLGENTRLYTSDKLNRDFPGRIFEICSIQKLDKKILSKQFPQKKANISIRNYPLSVDQIKKKIGFADGGDIYFFGATIYDNSKPIIICNKIK